MKELKPDDYYFKQLAKVFPYSDKFYIEEDEGDYYNRARTLFYDEYKILIKTKVHDYYG